MESFLRNRRQFLTLGLTFAVLVAIVTAVFPSTAQPASAAPNINSWDAGYIISDDLFYAGSSMSATDVQWFLDTVGPASCSPGYTCLKNYSAATNSRAADVMCAAYNGGGIESAATIIAKVGQACGISQKVLIVLLQKEQGLVTSSAPSAAKYDRATGYACPDTAPCNSLYFGLFNQLYSAAHQYKRYANPPGTSNYYTWFPVGQTTNIRWSPNSSCGSSPVTIRNKATAALYYYTPYQPNAAAMANLYGLGDGCSAYGNRNFWRMYSDWFGSPNGSDSSFLQALYQDLLGRPIDDAGKTFWLGSLRSGNTRAGVARAFLTSNENRSLLIEGVYQERLGRASDPEGFAFWMESLRRGMKQDDIRLSFIASEEYFDNLGRSNEAFVVDIFPLIMGREATAEEIDYYSNGAETVGRWEVVNGIYRSPESVALRMEAMYQKYLGTSFDQAGFGFWLAPMQTYGDIALLNGIFSSAEYDERARALYPLY